MAKVTYNTVLDHSSDAAWQAWADELYTALVACGLVQTADTGQLSTPVGVVRPANSTSAGYWIFRFDDTHQGAAPIFLRIEPGSQTATWPRILVTVGTGTNGAGTITGVLLAATTISNTSGSLFSTTIPYPSYVNHDDGFFGFAWKCGLATFGFGFISICRTCDSSGNPTADGYFITAKTAGGNAATHRSGKFGGTQIAVTNRTSCMVPMSVTSSAVGSDYQVYKVYGAYPEVRLVPQLVVVVKAELPTGTTTGAVEIIDGVNREYISIGEAGAACEVIGAGTYVYAMKWD